MCSGAHERHTRRLGGHHRCGGMQGEGHCTLERSFSPNRPLVLAIAVRARRLDRALGGTKARDPKS